MLFRPLSAGASIGLPDDFDPRLIAAQRLEAMPKHLKGISGDVQASPEIGVAFSDTPPGLFLGAGDAVEPCLRAGCGDLCPKSVAFSARPECEIEHDVDAQFEASGPDLLQEFGNPSVELREMLDRRIVAVEARHPLVMREADGRDSNSSRLASVVLPTPRYPWIK